MRILVLLYFIINNFKQKAQTSFFQIKKTSQYTYQVRSNYQILVSNPRNKFQKKSLPTNYKCSFVPKNKAKYYYITPPTKYKADQQIDEFAIDSNSSTDSSLKQQSSPMYYCPMGREPCGELQVVMGGDVIQVISQRRSRRKSRKFSDQETYAMSDFTTGPKSIDIPVPMFLQQK